MANADAIETRGVLWVVHEDGYITRKTGNYTEEKAPELFSYPKRPEIKPEEMIAHTLNGEVVCRDTEDGKLPSGYLRAKILNNKTLYMLLNGIN